MVQILRAGSLALLVAARMALVAQGQGTTAQTTRFEAARRTFCEVENSADARRVEASLAKLTEPDRQLLVEMARLPDTRLSFCARFLLVQVREPRVIPILLDYVADRSNPLPDRRLECDVVKPVAGPQGLPVMLGILAEQAKPEDSESRWLRICAIQALGNTGAQEARLRLRTLLERPEGPVQLEYVIDSLGRLQDSASIPRLIELLHAPLLQHWGATASALARIGTRESTAPLHDFVAAMKPGPDRQNVGTDIMRSLREAISTSKDERLKGELQQLHDRIRTLAFTREGRDDDPADLGGTRVKSKDLPDDLIQAYRDDQRQVVMPADGSGGGRDLATIGGGERHPCCCARSAANQVD